MKTRHVSIGDHTLAIHETGQGPPVLFGHSLTFDSQMWDAQVQALAENHRVILVDLHGHGASGSPQKAHSLEDMAQDLLALLDALEIDQCAWVGHSMGGMVGMRLALAAPHRIQSIALLNTSAEEQPEPMRTLFHDVNEKSRGKPSEPQTVQFVLNLMFSSAFQKAEPDQVAPFERLLYEPPDQEGTYWTARAVIWRTDVLDALRSLDIPALVVASEGDLSVPPEHAIKIADALPNANLIELGASGHLTPVERADEINRALTNHLNRTWSQA